MAPLRVSLATLFFVLAVLGRSDGYVSQENGEESPVSLDSHERKASHYVHLVVKRALIDGSSKGGAKLEQLAGVQTVKLNAAEEARSDRPFCFAFVCVCAPNFTSMHHGVFVPIFCRMDAVYESQCTMEYSCQSFVEWMLCTSLFVVHVHTAVW
jgi:hypothetical protein